MYITCCVCLKFVSGLRIRIANLVFKLLTCLLYIIRVVTDLDPTYATW
jgi:potassium channel subfamily T protein 1